jgi:hypothetical protein
MMLVNSNAKANGYNCICLPDMFRLTQEDITQGPQQICDSKSSYNTKLILKSSCILLHLTLEDPDPAIFVIDLQDAKKNFFLNFFCILLFEGTFN